MTFKRILSGAIISTALLLPIAASAQTINTHAPPPLPLGAKVGVVAPVIASSTANTAQAESPSSAGAAVPPTAGSGSATQLVIGGVILLLVLAGVGFFVSKNKTS